MAEANPLGRGIRELVKEMQSQTPNKIFKTQGEPIMEVEQNPPRIPNAPTGETVPLYILEDAQKQIAEIKLQAENAVSRMQELEKVNATFFQLEAEWKTEIRTLRDQVSKKDMQLRELSNRELEMRTKAEYSTQLVENIFEKIMDKI